ncbi:glycosyltransferase family 4 protein [Micromonospora mirobrigensis]|uniref:Glycosyltransferase involved in cell wall bisynthesis n=1 Tax=Micromonospora mirobrigensis TaxID=262898 RepID=A0A1C4ZBQ6_9ACTN|nr:glycosyltransferase family 4 protein [Micromonospora mirobrigensis]SCF30344.1 Glycosyltransferase involved in cell wall bisynthesis [Micromonospora mirobrigensis]
MRIAQLAPPYLPCPPVGYGGVERVIAELTDALVDRGHEVTLFAHPASRTRARLVSTRLTDRDSFDWQREVVHASESLQQMTDFDVLHNHSTAALPFRRFAPLPMVTTVHGTTGWEVIRPVYEHAREAAFVSISDSQRRFGVTDLNWIDTVYNGIDIDRFTLDPRRLDGRNYLLHMATLSERKGTADAVRIALATGRRLVIAGRVDPSDRAFYDAQVAPYVDGDQIRMIGEVDGPQKVELIQGAAAMVLPIHWEEPFGLVMAEAMACGVPVLVLDRGSARELVADGVTGFVRTTVDELCEAVPDLAGLDPYACRARVVERFSQDTMVDGYLAIYQKLAAT